MLRNKESSMDRNGEHEGVELGTGEIEFWVGEAEAPSENEPWLVLVADDEEDARDATRLAL